MRKKISFKGTSKVVRIHDYSKEFNQRVKNSQLFSKLEMYDDEETHSDVQSRLIKKYDYIQGSDDEKIKLTEEYIKNEVKEYNNKVIILDVCAVAAFTTLLGLSKTTNGLFNNNLIITGSLVDSLLACKLVLTSYRRYNANKAKKKLQDIKYDLNVKRFRF